MNKSETVERHHLLPINPKSNPWGPAGAAAVPSVPTCTSLIYSQHFYPSTELGSCSLPAPGRHPRLAATLRPHVAPPAAGGHRPPFSTPQLRPFPLLGAVRGDQFIYLFIYLLSNKATSPASERAMHTMSPATSLLGSLLQKKEEGGAFIYWSFLTQKRQFFCLTFCGWRG